MKRADRLMQIVQLLRRGGLHRAETLAQATGVHVRTIYRDMDTLAASGVPVSGERGVGYRITAAVTLPALNLTMAEVEALTVGLAIVGQSNDVALSRAAQALSARLDHLLPEETGEPAHHALAIYPFADAARGFQHLAALRQAVRARQRVQVTLQGRTISLRPLRLDYWGRLWTLTAWNETSRRFDDLRLDQITGLRLLPGLFVDEPGKTLDDYRAGLSGSAP
ncbi:HTH domain-containing protein [Loktanella sp. SALINAS62]|uniref:helix-turn-helix transcriptional regulator n=1 Tax=Loktanella sp. SALINAS62 TaxID=2706124 RepID=UPI001B8B5BA0|nr:HTH domain-containing protein [Loktanella sp. SALINAS62]MBS1301544.1 HTH domain-containing protein [Loktanella sp. SALINAS62]